MNQKSESVSPIDSLQKIAPSDAASRLKVAVLMGGKSSEREISLSTGRMITKALSTDRYHVRAIDTMELVQLTGRQPRQISDDDAGVQADSGKPDPEILTAAEAAERAEAESGFFPDVVFIALHGKGGEDGTVQGMLEMLGIPYTGSGVLASALAMDKTMSKQLFGSNGLPVIPGITLSARDLEDEEKLQASVDQAAGPGPVFVKPNAEGSTFGCTLVKDRTLLMDAVRTALSYDRLALVERYISGRELTIGVLEEKDGTPFALPIIEIVPKSAYYDYESKYAEGGSEHLIPAPISTELTCRAQAIAVESHRLLGCSGMSRTDLILDGEILYLLEVNTIPGMTPTSLLPQAAAAAGIRFEQLLDRLIDAALGA